MLRHLRSLPQPCVRWRPPVAVVERVLRNSLLTAAPSERLSISCQRASTHACAPPPPPPPQSYDCGTSLQPLLYDTLSGALTRAAKRWPHRRALISRSHAVAWTWAELDAAVDAAAAGLLAAGASRGDRVAIWALNRPEWVVMQLAAARAGLVFVTINPAYRASELAYALRAVGVSLLVMATAFRTSNYVSLLAEARATAPGGLPELRTVVQLDAPVVGPAPGLISWKELVAGGSGGAAARAQLASQAAALRPDDVANVQFTSGTTGRPKAVQLSHVNILNNGSLCAQALKLTAADAICVPVPLFHCFGSVLGVCAALSTGAALVFPGEGFDARKTLAAVADERCTVLYGVPTMFVAELAVPDLPRFDLSSLRAGLMSGAPCPIELARALESKMHMRDITVGYGMTETGPLSCMSPVDAPLDVRVGSVGRVLPHVEVKIIDDTGAVVPRGHTGELCTRGHGVMRGYLGDAAATRAAIDDAGWMRSGDLATMDASGYVRIVGRLKDMIIRGGENVYPAEVESFLLTHPAVLDAQVFGVADALYGEEVVAWIRLRASMPSLSADDVRAFCAGIAHHKRPRIIEFVDAFPLTTSGKPQKFIMRAAVEARLSRAPAPAAP